MPSIYLFQMPPEGKEYFLPDGPTLSADPGIEVAAFFDEHLEK